MRTIGASQRRCESKEKKSNFWVELDLGSQPRNWAEFIHEFIDRHWVGPYRSEKSCDGVVGVEKVLSSVGEASLDSWSDKSYLGF